MMAACVFVTIEIAFRISHKNQQQTTTHDIFRQNSDITLGSFDGERQKKNKNQKEREKQRTCSENHL